LKANVLKVISLAKEAARPSTVTLAVVAVHMGFAVSGDWVNHVFPSTPGSDYNGRVLLVQPQSPGGGSFMVLPRFALPILVALCGLAGVVALGAPAAKKPDATAAKGDASDTSKAAESRPKTAPSRDSGAGSKTPAGTKPIPTSFVSLLKEGAGRQVLVINYRWKVHSKASIEVRLLPNDDKEETLVSPTYFVSDLFKGPVATKVYRCLDSAGDLATTDSFTKDKMEYKIIGQRNALGHPSILIIPYPEGGTVTRRPTAIFPLLDAWAINDRLLDLELPRDAFAKPGRLHVWFLRGDHEVWEEAIDWPGYLAK
jgi:hypothetical protein